jgi:hypothetical protein
MILKATTLLCPYLFVALFFQIDITLHLNILVFQDFLSLSTFLRKMRHQTLKDLVLNSSAKNIRQ